jgi:hypothetical protein
MIVLLLRRYWQELAVGLLAVAILTMASIYLHRRDQEHEAIGEARIQAKWDKEKAAQAQKLADLTNRVRAVEAERNANAATIHQQEIDHAAVIATLQSAVTAGDVRLRNATSAFQSRLSATSKIDGGTAALDAAGRLAEMAATCSGLLGEARVLLERASGDISTREAVIDSDRHSTKPAFSLIHPDPLAQY